MEFNLWHKTQAKPLIRYLAFGCLVFLLIFYTIHFEAFERYLVNLHPLPIIPLTIWILYTKLFSYALHILINFFILLIITNRLHYSLTMVYVAFFVLLIGAALLFMKEISGLPIPLSVIAFIVKINKSFLLLVLFIAGHIVMQNNLNQKV